MRDDLIEQALFGLAIAGDRAARERLEDVAAGQFKPAKTGRDQRGAAGQALGQRSEPSPLLDGPAGGGAATPAFDTNTTFHDSLIDYANHPAVSDSMTDSRLDSVLDDGSGRVFQDDGALSGGADTACCVSFSRKGAQQTFGSSADGLDAIDTYSELITVLNDQTARAKVVCQINYCSGPGTNIIGCAWVSGNGLAVVRMSSLGQEAALWVHEYGHNIGNGHNNLGTNWIMYGSLGSNNRGILQSECDQYHQPASAAEADVVEAGMCSEQQLDTIGLFAPENSTFRLRNHFSGGPSDVILQFGGSNSGRSLTGNWNGIMADTIGRFDPLESVFRLRNSNSDGGSNVLFQFGPRNTGWIPITGDWDGDGLDTIALYDPVESRFRLKNSNSGGAASAVFDFGPRNWAGFRSRATGTVTGVTVSGSSTPQRVPSGLRTGSRGARRTRYSSSDRPTLDGSPWPATGIRALIGRGPEF